MCLVKNCGGLHFKEFIERSALYYQFKFFETRKPEAYGAKVHSDLAGILSELHQKPPVRKRWLALIVDLHAAKLADKLVL